MPCGKPLVRHQLAHAIERESHRVDERLANAGAIRRDRLDEPDRPPLVAEPQPQVVEIDRAGRIALVGLHDDTDRRLRLREHLP